MRRRLRDWSDGFEVWLGEHRSTRVARGAITGFIAAIGGGLWWGAAQPAPPGLPTIRTWQREHALVHLDWVRERMQRF